MGNDPAHWRSLLIAERAVGRREIAVAVGLLATAVGVAVVGMFGSHAVLTLATFYVPTVLVIGLVRLLPRAIGRHVRASYKLRQLHSRDTGLPAARLVEK